jgi:predicted nucleic acid-binding protein
MKILLDTRVVCELRKERRRLSPAFAAWVDSVDIEDLYISVVSIQEIQVAILRLTAKDPLGGTSYREWLDRKVFSIFKNRILPVTLDAVVTTRTIKADFLFDNITLIAATANTNGCIVATNTPEDFEALGARAFDPWKKS